MIKCPNCEALLPDKIPQTECPKCGKAISGPTSAKTANLNEATIDATLDAEMLAGLGDPEELGATIGLMLDPTNISPMSTISIGASGITKGGSTPSPSDVKGTTHGGVAVRTGAANKTASNTGQGAVDTSFDFNRSVLSTISKRTLAEKAGPLSSPPDYEIVNKLGEGGMGVVYSAIQKTLDRTVAIKAIKAGKATSEESRRKFFYEAQITSDLDHPNIVPIHEMGSNDDGTLFYSMKMVSGTPWEDAIEGKTREENIDILMKVCDAVAFAHSRNIIHRDLKPENVMLGAFGEVLVMDWGLAVNMNTNQKFGLSGTPVYMAPEMAKHDLSKIGKASDIYILGAILFQVVAGKAPHKGKTVRECMANAMLNINIEPGFEDPLLDIANHAMATEPEDRYASVIAFQDAIREHLRYAQSIALTHRAEELLEKAILDKDYQGFSRALFSMQDAIELWPENQEAKDGLHRTRLAYGQCALDRSDYDLCLQTLDVQLEDEAALHGLAMERKAGIVQREKRFKLLRRVLAAVILFAVVSLTIATLYALNQTKIAQEKEGQANESAKREKLAHEQEVVAKHEAQESAKNEKTARIDEEKARQQAQVERNEAVLAKELEMAARVEAVASENKAKESERDAKESEKRAIESKQIADRNARLALLGNYQSELNLALNQTNQFDIARSTQLLQQIRTIEESLAATRESTDGKLGASGPLLQNWAFRRIELLNNRDLPNVRIEGSVTAFQFASASELGIIATSSGQVSLVQLANGALSLVPDRTLALQGPINDIAISPDGQDAIITTGSRQSEYTVYRWKTNSQEALPIRSLGKRDLQRLAVSEDGKWIVGGINSGLWVWQRNESGLDAEPKLLECKGSLACLQFIGASGNEVFGLSKLTNGKSVCVRADLRTNAIQNYSLPESIESKVSSAAMSFDQRRVYLGLIDGNFLIANCDSTSTGGVSTQGNLLVKTPSPALSITVEGEVQPKKHTTAIRGLQVHTDGTILTHSDEPVVHVWTAKPSSSKVNYRSFLVGLTGNVTNAKFLAGSGDIAATDDLGNLQRWNLSDQSDRRAVMQSQPTRLISQAMSKDGTIRTVDIHGVLRTSYSNLPSTQDSEDISFVGHTPGAKVSDVAAAASEPLVATIASLPASLANVNTSEVCIWNVVSRKMLHRLQYKTTGLCRIAFANRDKFLVVGDGKETIIIPMDSPEKGTVEKRFGTSLVSIHPTQASLTALIATSGSVRMVDWQDPSKWEDLGYRYFDIAIKNPYAPLEAAWAADGKRLFILFDHGRIARLEWDGVSLSNLSWTDEIPALRSVEQVTPWCHYEFEVNATSRDVDRLTIVHRTSESKPKSVQSQFDWSRSDSRPKLGKTNSISELTSAVAFPRPNPHDVFKTSQSSAFGSGTIEIDRNGTLNLTPLNKTAFSIGRPECLNASHSFDGKRWATVHSDGIVLLATSSESNPVAWHPVKHPFVNVSQAELSADGLRLLIVGRLPNGESKLVRFEIEGSDSVMPAKGGEVANVRFVRWHPVDNEFVMLDADQNWHRTDSDGLRHALKSQVWDTISLDPSSLFVSMEWLSEPLGNIAKPLYHMAILSRTKESSRIDFISVDSSSAYEFQPIQPIVSKSKITSFAAATNENILAVGDEKGTLGIWFVSPSFDQSPRELFTLPCHRGAAVSQLTFSGDGSTIFSSDSSQRSIQWRSR